MLAATPDNETALNAHGPESKRVRTFAWPRLLGVACLFGFSCRLACCAWPCFAPGASAPPGRRRKPSDPTVLRPCRRFSAQLLQRETMDGPLLHSLVSQARHAAAAGHPPELPQRASGSLVDSGLGGLGGDVAFSAGTRRVPFTPTRAALKKLRVSHDSGPTLVRHRDLLTSTTSSSNYNATRVACIIIMEFEAPSNFPDASCSEELPSPRMRSGTG